MNKKSFIKKMAFLIPLFISLLVGPAWSESGRGLTKFEQELKEAKSYEEEGEYKKAEEVYQALIKEYEGTTYALKAQQWLITLYIRSGTEDKAKTAFDKLLADFSGHPDLVGAIYEIACQWDDVTAKNGDIENYEKANRIYNDIIQKHPESDFAEKSEWRLRKNLIFSYIDEGKDNEVEKAVDELIANYSEHPMFGQMIDWIEEKYYNKILQEGKCPTCGSTESVYFEKAVKMWEKVMEIFPEFFYNDPTLYLFIATSYSNLGEYGKAVENFQKVVDNFPQYERIPSALFHIIQNYERLKDSGVISESEANLKTAEVYKTLAEKYPTSRKAVIVHVNMQRRLAISYIESGNEPEAERVFKKLISDLENVISLTEDKSEKMFARLKIAEVYLAGKDYSKSRDELETILRLYPNMWAADRAKLMLIGMDTFKLY